MNKLLTSLALTLVLCVSTVTTSQAVNLDGASPWATELLKSAISHNLVPTHLQNNYSQNMTRAEFCALATVTYEAMTGTEITERKTFSDTDDVNVEKMASLGVVSGTSETTFTPDKLLNRQEAAVILANLYSVLHGEMGEAEITFTDNEAVSPWASTAVGKVCKAGIMSGLGDNRFAPQDSYTREQSMVTMLRVFEGNNTGDEGETPTTPDSGLTVSERAWALLEIYNAPVELSLSTLSISSDMNQSYKKFKAFGSSSYLSEMNKDLTALKTASNSIIYDLNRMIELCGDVAELSALKKLCETARTSYSTIYNSNFDPYDFNYSGTTLLNAMDAQITVQEKVIDGSEEMNGLLLEVGNLFLLV